MSPHRSRKGLIALIIGLASASTFIPSGVSGAEQSHGFSPTALARQLDLTAADLPTSTEWTSSAQVPNTPLEIKQAKQAVLCMKDEKGTSGNVSPDPFGTVGSVGGPVVADVESFNFAQQGSGTGLPGVNSDVVVLTSSAQAKKDLAAFATKHDRVCSTTLIGDATSDEVGQKLAVNSSFLSLPRHGTGNSGVHMRFVLKGSILPGTLYEDVYFYVQGRVEISISFLNVGSPFAQSWANFIAGSVMTRAADLVPSLA